MAYRASPQSNTIHATHITVGPSVCVALLMELEQDLIDRTLTPATHSNCYRKCFFLRDQCPLEELLAYRKINNLLINKSALNVHKV